MAAASPTAAPAPTSCNGFSVENSCGPEIGPPPGLAYAILNQGLDGSSLVVQGGPNGDDIRITHGGQGWTVTNGAGIFAGEGCVSVTSNATAVACAGDAALVVVTGNAGSDNLVIDPSVPASAKVRVNGNAGGDTLVGGPEDDVLEAGENYNGPDNGNDVLHGEGGNDVLYADPGADQLDGGIGEDLLVSSVEVCQGHRFDGGAGEDTVSYARSTTGVRMTLGGSGGPAGCGSLDQILSNNESLEGSDGPDVMTGDNGENSFLGHLGADTFIAKGGNDFIDAADGQHDKQIICGGGNDEVIKDGTDPTSLLSGWPRTLRRRSGARSGRGRSPRSRCPRRCRRRRVSRSVSSSPAIGSTMRPPSASWETSAGGGAGAVAWTAIASNGARSGMPWLPSPIVSSTLVDGQRGEGFAGREGERPWRSTLITSRRQQREHAGRVAGAGADLQHPLAAAQLQRLADRGDDPGLGDRLAGIDRQRRVGVGAVAQRAGHEDLTRHLRHRRQHPLVVDLAPAQLPLHHPRAEAGEIGHG